VHGLAANHRNVDPDEDRSLSRHLHGLGRDVWLLSLRSGQAGLTARERDKVDFRAMVDKDLPVAIDFVRERTRSERIDYVGFSMGGMLLYAALGRSVDPSVLHRVALIGSPGRVSPPFAFMRVFAFLPRFAIRGIWLRLMARMAAFIAERLRTPIHHHIYNPDNVSRGAVARALVNLIEDVHAPLSADFAGWALSDGVVRVDGEDILSRLGAVSVPAVFFAGAADRIARADAVRAAYEAWGAGVDNVEKRFVLLGKAGGQAHDYGHGDLVIGERVVEEAYAPLGRFLAGS
jgi:pimeloyl-ACP methyl ester carboxylesterase